MPSPVAVAGAVEEGRDVCIVTRYREVPVLASSPGKTQHSLSWRLKSKHCWHSKRQNQSHFGKNDPRVKPRVAPSPVRTHSGPRHLRPAVSTSRWVMPTSRPPCFGSRLPQRASAVRERARGGGGKLQHGKPSLFHVRKSSRLEVVLRATRRATRCPATVFRGSHRRSSARSTRCPVQHSGPSLCHPLMQPRVGPIVISFAGGGWEYVRGRVSTLAPDAVRPAARARAAGVDGARRPAVITHRPVCAWFRRSGDRRDVGALLALAIRSTSDSITHPTHNREHAPLSLPPRSDCRTFSNTPHAPHARA